MAQLTDEWGHAETLLSTDPEYKMVYDASVESLKECLEYLGREDWKSKTGWKLEQERPSGDKCYSKSAVQKKGKTFIGLFMYDINIFWGRFEISAEALLDEMWKEMESVPTWNTDILEYRRIMEVGAQTDVTYNVFADAAGGVVSSRDFVDCRCWRKIGDSFCIAGKSVTVKCMPAQKGRVRGEDYAGVFQIIRIDDNTCDVVFTQNTDLKGFIPKSIVERLISGTLLDFLEKLRIRCASIAKN